jgi:hypothetical protein
MFVCLHLAAFSRAGHERLGLPFNSTPDERPYFSDPEAQATVGFPRQPHRWSRLVVSRLDAQHYIGTSVRNVTACPTTGEGPDVLYLHCGLGWLPAFGIIGGAVSQVTGLADDFVLLLLSLLAALAVNWLLISETITKRIGRPEAYALLVAFNLYPAAFYMVTPLTEAVTIALCLGGFIALCKERWFMSAALIGGASAFRIAAGALGIGLGCALLVIAWQRRKAGSPRWWLPVLAATLCGWGQMVTMLVLKLSVGDFWAFFRARAAFGDKHDWSRLFSPENYLRGFAAQTMDMVIFTGVVAIILLTGRHVLRKFNTAEQTYLVVASAVTIVLAIVAPLHYWGITRYMMLCPLAYLCIAELARRHTALFVAWLVLCVFFYWHVELCSYITQGNPQICPCLGRMELWLPFES